MKSRIFCIFVKISSQSELFLYNNDDLSKKKIIDAISDYFEHGDIRERLISPSSESVRRERFAAYSALLFATEQLLGIMPKIDFNSNKPRFSEENILLGEGSGVPEFNISHSSGLALVCLSDAYQIGCDIQAEISEDRAQRIGERLIRSRKKYLSPSLPLLCPECTNDCSGDFEVLHYFFDCQSGELIPIEPQSVIDGNNPSGLCFGFGKSTVGSAEGLEVTEADDVLKSWCTLESILKCIGGGFGSLSDIDGEADKITTLGSPLSLKGEKYYASISVLKK